MNPTIEVFEHQVLRIGEGGLSEAQFAALVLFNQRHQDRFFVVRHRSLKFSSYVGVVQVGGLTIEVLPKADSSEAGDKGKWRDALIEMLWACGYLKLAAVSTASLRLHHGSLFDLYMEAFLAEAQVLLHGGLVKKYRKVTGNITALKGRLLFSRQIAENLIHRERFVTVHEQYNRNNVFNQILLRAVRIVASAARSDAIRGLAAGLLIGMDGIDRAAVTADTFRKLQFDRSTERYRSALTLARLIILNYQPDVRAGRHDVLAILFDMNELFEEYVLRQLQRGAVRSGAEVEVRAQARRAFWRAGDAVRGIKPDILVTLKRPGAGSETIVLDTKWKVPSAPHPDDADLKQMYSYNLQLGAGRSFLVYPRVDARRDVLGTFECPYHDPTLKHGCGMWFIDLFAGKRLRKDLGALMIGRLRGETSVAA